MLPRHISPATRFILTPKGKGMNIPYTETTIFGAPQRLYLMKWHGPYSLDMCKLIPSQNQAIWLRLKIIDPLKLMVGICWNPTSSWSQIFSKLHIKTLCHSNESKCVHPVLHLWLPHFFGTFGFRRPTFLLLFMHLATVGRKPQRAKNHDLIFFRKVVTHVKGMRVSFQQLTCQTPDSFLSKGPKKNYTP